MDDGKINISYTNANFSTPDKLSLQLIIKPCIMFHEIAIIDNHQQSTQYIPIGQKNVTRVSTLAIVSSDVCLLVKWKIEKKSSLWMTQDMEKEFLSIPETF